MEVSFCQLGGVGDFFFLFTRVSLLRNNRLLPIDHATPTESKELHHGSAKQPKQQQQR